MELEHWEHKCSHGASHGKRKDNTKRIESTLQKETNRIKEQCQRCYDKLGVTDIIPNLGASRSPVALPGRLKPAGVRPSGVGRTAARQEAPTSACRSRVALSSGLRSIVFSLFLSWLLLRFSGAFLRGVSGVAFYCSLWRARLGARLPWKRTVSPQSGRLLQGAGARALQSGDGVLPLFLLLSSL